MLHPVCPSAIVCADAPRVASNVRQSAPPQVQTNLESRRRQYELANEARRRGFLHIEVIDDDLGRSDSGAVARPGFDRLVAWLSAGEVGAVRLGALLFGAMKWVWQFEG